MGRDMKHEEYKTRNDLIVGLERAKKTKTCYIPFEQWSEKLRKENEDLVIENLILCYKHKQVLDINWAFIDFTSRDTFYTSMRLMDAGIIDQEEATEFLYNGFIVAFLKHCLYYFTVPREHVNVYASRKEFKRCNNTDDVIFSYKFSSTGRVLIVTKKK